MIPIKKYILTILLMIIFLGNTEGAEETTSIPFTPSLSYTKLATPYGEEKAKKNTKKYDYSPENDIRIDMNSQLKFSPNEEPKPDYGSFNYVDPSYQMIQNFRQKSEALKEAQQKRNCCLCAGIACAGTASVACAAVMVGIMSVPLILAILSDRSEELALASAICNSAWVFMSFVGKNNSTNGCSALLYVGALITSWIYWSQWYNDKPLNPSLQDATIGMTVFAPILSILGAWLSKDEQ